MRNTLHLLAFAALKTRSLKIPSERAVINLQPGHHQAASTTQPTSTELYFITRPAHNTSVLVPRTACSNSLPHLYARHHLTHTQLSCCTKLQFAATTTHKHNTLSTKFDIFHNLSPTFRQFTMESTRSANLISQSSMQPKRKPTAGSEPQPARNTSTALQLLEANTDQENSLAVPSQHERGILPTAGNNTTSTPNYMEGPVIPSAWERPIPSYTLPVHAIPSTTTSDSISASAYAPSAWAYNLPAFPAYALPPWTITGEQMYANVHSYGKPSERSFISYWHLVRDGAGGSGN